MEVYEKKVEIRWSDLDPNYHLRHSVYYDLGAYCRIAFLSENGVTSQVMSSHHIGPVLFREECVFKREVKFGDEVKVNLKLNQSTHDMRRWTLVHELWKQDEVLAAIITVDGAWLDTGLRKLAIPPAIFKTAFEMIPKTEGFAFIEKNNLIAEQFINTTIT